MMIDFDSIDHKKVSILCKHPENIQVLVEFLKSKQFEVHFEKLPGSFFQSITDLQPGIVMISHEMNDQMGKVFPNFIHKKFKIPVLLFHESNKKPEHAIKQPDLAALSGSSPAIRATDHSSPEKIHEEIETFRQNYQQAVSQMSKSAGLVSMENLKQERLERQGEIIRRLEDKIKLASTYLEGKENLDMLSIKVLDPTGHGCFLFFTELPQGKRMSEFQEELALDLQLPNEKQLVIESIDSSVGKELFLRLKDTSDQVLQGFWGEQEIMVLYYMDAQKENLEEITITEEGYLVPVETWWSKVPLNFNAHLFLRLNNKQLLYINRGDRFLDRNIPIFIDRNQRVLIKGEDFYAFQQLAEIASLAQI